MEFGFHLGMVRRSLRLRTLRGILHRTSQPSTQCSLTKGMRTGHLPRRMCTSLDCCRPTRGTKGTPLRSSSLCSPVNTCSSRRLASCRCTSHGVVRHTADLQRWGTGTDTRRRSTQCRNRHNLVVASLPGTRTLRSLVDPSRTPRARCMGSRRRRDIGWCKRCRSIRTHMCCSRCWSRARRMGR